LTWPDIDGFELEDVPRGGHTAAHPPTHVTFWAWSGANAYSVRPLPSTSTVPTPGTERVFSWTPLVEAGGFVVDAAAVADGEDELLLLLPQAAISSATGRAKVKSDFLIWDSFGSGAALDASVTKDSGDEVFLPRSPYCGSTSTLIVTPRRTACTAKWSTAPPTARTVG
jgi:hypothetical protein